MKKCIINSEPLTLNHYKMTKINPIIATLEESCFFDVHSIDDSPTQAVPNFFSTKKESNSFSKMEKNYTKLLDGGKKPIAIGNLLPIKVAKRLSQISNKDKVHFKSIEVSQQSISVSKSSDTVTQNNIEASMFNSIEMHDPSRIRNSIFDKLYKSQISIDRIKSLVVDREQTHREKSLINDINCEIVNLEIELAKIDSSTPNFTEQHKNQTNVNSPNSNNRSKNINNFLGWSHLDHELDERVPDMTSKHFFKKKNLLAFVMDDENGYHGFHLTFNFSEFGEALVKKTNDLNLLMKLRDHLLINKREEMVEKELEEGMDCVCEICSNLGIICEWNMPCYKKKCGHVTHSCCSRLVLKSLNVDDNSIKDLCPLCHQTGLELICAV